MPHYKKAFDIGTYTGNGGQYRVGIPTLRSVGPTGTQIVGSLRFRSSNTNHLYRTPASNTSSNKKVTFSCWIKIGSLSSSTNNGTFLGAADNYHYGQFYSNTLYFGNVSYYLNTTAKFIDPSIWYHVFFVADSTLATTNDRMQIWVNGTRQAAGSFNTQPTLNASFEFFNTTQQYIIGKRNTGSEFDGYLSQVYFVDGQALTPSSFGEYNSDGIWVPKAYSGTYGTNGFYLPMNSSSNYATDQSGNGNNFTPSGFNTTTANTTYDIMTDSPTDYLSGSMSTANNAGNYASLSPYNKSSALTVSNGNLYFTGGSSGGGDTFSQIAVNMNLPTTGKWYFEFQPQSTGSDANTFGFNITRRNRDGNGWPATRSNPGYPGYYSFEYGLYLGGGSASDTLAFRNNYVTNATTTQIATGVVTNVYTAWYGVAIDCDSSTFQMYRNGVALGSATSFVHPGTDAFIALMKGDFAMAANFGQQPFGYGVPSGYKALNTYNIPRPADSSLWFYGDTPDLIWIKNRTTSAHHSLTDTVRGVGLDLLSSYTDADSPSLISDMNKFGITMIYSSTLTARTNLSASNYVYWAWKAGSNTSSTSVTNTDGTITSQVSANRQAGFSIVTYTGTGATSSTSTIGHGLGAAPAFIITKKRSSGTTDYGWSTWHTSLGGNYGLWLNSTAARNPGMWAGYSSFSSTVFTPPDKDYGNVSGETYVNYLWTAIPGYSAFGSYAGNGAADGPFVYLGFRPRFVLYKRTDSTGGWVIIDTSRDTYNYASKELYPHLSNGENSTSAQIDVLSNGYKIRTDSTYTYNNASGGTYIYAAFAEIPFKFARAR